MNAGYIHRVNAAYMSAQGKFLDAIKVTKTDVSPGLGWVLGWKG